MDKNKFLTYWMIMNLIGFIAFGITIVYVIIRTIIG